MMSVDLLQDAVVTVAALGAGSLVLRRLFGFVRPAAKPGCASCPSARGDCATPAATEPPSSPATHPLILVRRTNR
jgi:hypothetical protein